MKDYRYAFPLTDEEFRHLGLTRRELFAAMAMEGMLGNSSPNAFVNHGEGEKRMIAWHAVKYADELVAELDKPAEAKGDA